MLKRKNMKQTEKLTKVQSERRSLKQAERLTKLLTERQNLKDEVLDLDLKVSASDDVQMKQWLVVKKHNLYKQIQKLDQLIHQQEKIKSKKGLPSY